MALALAMNEGDARTSPVASATDWQVGCATMTPQLAQEWDALCASGTASPYQSRRWVMDFMATAGKAAGEELALVTVRDRAGKLLALFALALAARRKARIASFVGAKHANYHMPLLDPDFAKALDRVAMHQLMKDVTAALARDGKAVHAFSFINQPWLWIGAPHPMSLIASWNGTQPAYAMSLREGALAAMERSMSSHARKSLRNKRRRLDEIGKVSLLTARDERDIVAIRDAFVTQKAARFEGLGIADPFAEPGVLEMLAAAAISTADGQPAIVWHGLMMDGAVIATFVGAVDGLRYSGMATSFDADHAAAKHSPGEALLVELLQEQATAGRRMFDLGVGEARYKTTFCDTRDAMFETVWPVSARGYAIMARLQLRRMAKQLAIRLGEKSPLLLKLARRMAAR
jgi:CelD/BcsL family acetyltransferase involved in cellulose biosynthesis